MDITAPHARDHLRRFATTWHRFVFFGPRRFWSHHVANPDDDLDSPSFIVTTGLAFFTLIGAILIVIGRAPSESVAVALSSAAILWPWFAAALAARAAAAILRLPLNTSTFLDATFYASALLPIVPLLLTVGLSSDVPVYDLVGIVAAAAVAWFVAVQVLVATARFHGFALRRFLPISFLLTLAFTSPVSAIAVYRATFWWDRTIALVKPWATFNVDAQDITTLLVSSSDCYNCYAPRVGGLTPGKQVFLKVYYHNNAWRTETYAENTRVQIRFRSATDGVVVIAKIEADNAKPAYGVADLFFAPGTEGARLEIVDAQWYPGNGDPQPLPAGQTPADLLSVNGVHIGRIGPFWAYQGSVYVTCRVAQ